MHLDGLTSSLKWGPEDLAWFERTLGTSPSSQVVERDGVRSYERVEGTEPELARGAPAWKPPAGVELTPALVNGMTPAGQWGYKAASSTRPRSSAAKRRPARPAAGGRRAPSAAAVEVERLRARVRELEADNARLGRLLAQKGRPRGRHVQAATDDGGQVELIA